MLEEVLCLCMKISQQKWIESLKNGSAWFSAIGEYIKKAEETGNDQQGDKYEGVFAHCRKNSDIYNASLNQFGSDLETIDDGEYCFLRRKSSRKVYAFCMYGIKNTELQIQPDSLYIENNIMKAKFSYVIDSKMYSDFLQDGTASADITGFYCSAGHINEAIEKELNKNGYSWIRKMVKYDIDLDKEFYIEPSEDYPELMHKRKDLSYQHESRFLVFDFKNEKTGFSLDYIPLSNNSGEFAFGELYIEGTAIVNDKEEQ